MQTYTKGYAKVLSSKVYNMNVFSNLLEPFSSLPLVIEDCRINLDGIEVNVCTNKFDLVKFMSVINEHAPEVISMFNQALVYRSLSRSLIKEQLLSKVYEMVKGETPVDLSVLSCNKVIEGVDVKTVLVSGIPFIRYSKYPFTLVIPAKIDANLSCFVDEVSKKLGNTTLRFTVDPYPTIYLNHHAIMTLKHDVKDEVFYLKVISFIKRIVENQGLFDQISLIAKQIKEIEDREIYYEFKLKAYVEEIENKLKELYLTTYDSK